MAMATRALQQQSSSFASSKFLTASKSSCSSSGSLWGPSSVCGIRSTGVLAPLRTSTKARKTIHRSNKLAAVLQNNDRYVETEEEITAAYEAIYGKAFGASGPKRSWASAGAGGDVKDGEGGDDAGGKARGRGRGAPAPDSGRGGRGGPRGDFDERVVQIRRVTKVVKGGKQLSFRAVVVVGDKKGKVGVGVNKAKEVITAVQKASLNAKRNLVNVPMTKYKTFPHRADGHYGAAHVMLRPASVGTGVIAGGAVRVVLELAGVENALGKQIGSENPLNNARAVVEAVSSMKTFAQVSIDRGIPMEELWK